MIFKLKISFALIFLIYILIFNKWKDNNKYRALNVQKKNNYTSKKFAILRRLECPICGLFSFYMVNLGCVNYYLSLGYVPIIDLQTFPNMYNGGNISIYNPWELFFYQAYNYTLEEVKKYSTNITYFNCVANNIYRPNAFNIYYDNNTLTFWHNFALKYMPLKIEMIKEAEIKMKEFFGASKNILGVLTRGTDYIYLKPKKHSIPPTVEQVISDTKAMDKLNRYDFIFFSTEDEIIKQKFKKSFDYKLKMLNPNIILQYDYTKDKKFINLNEKIYGNLEYVKNYILNIIILSKCLDIIAAKCNGAAGIFILSNGFRYTKIYNLGLY